MSLWLYNVQNLNKYQEQKKQKKKGMLQRIMMAFMWTMKMEDTFMGDNESMIPFLKL